MFCGSRNWTIGSLTLAALMFELDRKLEGLLVAMFCFFISKLASKKMDIWMYGMNTWLGEGTISWP